MSLSREFVIEQQAALLADKDKRIESAQARIAALEAVIAEHNARLTHACATHPFTARCAALSKDGECLYCPMRFAIEVPA